MTKTEIKEKRTELVKVLLELKSANNRKVALVKALTPDFEANEAEYRNGIKTEAGVLIRKPSWNVEAKPIVEVA